MATPAGRPWGESRWLTSLESQLRGGTFPLEDPTQAWSQVSGAGLEGVVGSQAGAFGFWDRECWERGAGFTWSTEKGKCLAAAFPGENEWLLEMKGCFRGAPRARSGTGAQGSQKGRLNWMDNERGIRLQGVLCGPGLGLGFGGSKAGISVWSGKCERMREVKMCVGPEPAR